MRWGSTRFCWALAAVVVVALALRVGLVFATPHFAPVNDAADFDRLGVALAEGRGYGAAWTELVPGGGPTAFRPPGLPVLLGAVYKVAGTGSPKARWRAARIVEAVLGAATVALIALLALRLAGPGAGLAAGALAAVYPPLLVTGGSLLAESLFLPLMLGALLAVVAARRGAHRWRWALVAGALAGLGALTRPNGLVLVPVLALAVGLAPRRAWRPALLLIAGAVLVVAPWTIRNAVQLHAFVPVATESGYTLSGTYQDAARDNRRYPAVWAVPTRTVLALARAHPHMREAEWEHRLVSKALRFVGDHPEYLATVGLWNTVRMLHLQGPHLEMRTERSNGVDASLGYAGVYGFWAVALLALAAAFTRARSAVPWWMWLGALVLAASAVWTGGGVGRYRVPSDVPVLVLAGAGIALAIERVRARPARRPELVRAP